MRRRDFLGVAGAFVVGGRLPHIASGGRYTRHAARPVPTPAQLDAYTAADVQRFFDGNFSAARTRLYIAGRFDVEAMRSAIGKAFATWKLSLIHI